jgi:hypothetical protein
MRSAPEPSALQAALDAFERDRAEHLTAGPADAEELRRTEDRLGVRLPTPFRSFLKRVGGGLFYQRHEIFGSHRVMLHDIELVPDLVSFGRALRRAGGPNPPAGVLPFHREGGRVHVLDLRGSEPDSAPVRALDGSRSFPSLADFLETLVPDGSPGDPSRDA